MGVGEETWCDLIVTFLFFSLRVRETARLFISRLLFKVRYGKEVAYLPGTRKVPWLHGTAYLSYVCPHDEVLAEQDRQIIECSEPPIPERNLTALAYMFSLPPS